MPQLPKPRNFDEASAVYTGDIATVARMLDENPARIQAQFAYYGQMHYAVRGGQAAIAGEHLA